MKPDRHDEDVEDEHVEALREGSAAGVFAGAVIILLLAVSAILITYFWPVFQIAATQSNEPTPTIQE